MLKCGTVVSVCLACLGMFASDATAGSADIHSAITMAPATAGYGETIRLQVAYGNNGPDEAVAGYMNVNFPTGVYYDDDEWTFSWEASDDNVIAGLFWASACDGVIVQMQGPGDPNDRPIPMDLPSGAAGTLDLEFAMPMTNPTVGVVRVDSPPDLAGPLVTGSTSCDTCEDLNTCFGMPISLVNPPVSGEFVVVDDGVEPVTDGCEPIVNDITGLIALIRRGACEFGLKAINAQNAGAAAVIIMNDRVQDISTFVMGGGAFGALVNVPTTMIDQTDGDAIEASVNGGELPTGTMGGEETFDALFTSNIFHSGVGDTDPDESNNSDTHITVLDPLARVFSDGFETGDTSAWSSGSTGI